MTEPSNVRKARIKSLSSAKRIVNQRIKEEYELEGADKLKFEIDHLENVVRNCKMDLNGAFKGNMAIQIKMANAEAQLAAKKEELRILSEKV